MTNDTNRIAESSSPSRIPVVGLGGSAGALKAFEDFFDALPAHSGAAFIIIQHLSPTQESMLPEILSHHTRMRVVQAEDGMALEPDCVYVIPPGTQLGIRKGSLFLIGPDQGVSLPIDFLFQCLAEDREERAIGVLLSGAGSDGTAGARSIRGHGGMVIAQDPGTAQFGDLPHNAVAAGLVDHVLSPESMPQAILHYFQHPYVKGRANLPDTGGKDESKDVQDILDLVLNQTGCDFRCYKLTTILRRIGRRMGLAHINDTHSYGARLRRDPQEVKRLLQDLLINVTSFFRDPKAFDEVQTRAIEPLVLEKPATEPFRVWVPACSTGEEAYSLAILFAEEIAKSGKNCPLQLFATDLDSEAMQVARAGFYSEHIAAEVRPELLQKYFIRVEKGYQVKDSLRETITFAVQNVLTDPPFSKMDLVSCRNLLIYLEADAQTKLMGLFNFSLKPDGYLFLGKAETVAGQIDLFEPASTTTKLFQRLAPGRPLLLDSPILPGKKRPSLHPHVTISPVSSNFADVLRLEILKHFGACAVLVDRTGRIFQFHGQTDRYLNLPAPGPEFNMFELAKEKLTTRLRLGTHKAIQDDKTIRLENIPLVREDGIGYARITITPVSQRGYFESLLVVFFEDVPPPVIEPDSHPSSDNDAVIKKLETELQETQQDLQSTIMELQSSNEELRAANEETTSTNEELESTNEELMSSTEELQSSNEELTAVVNQLQEKVNLLNRANTDMTNLLASPQITTLFLDKDMRIKFFTPTIPGIINITTKDIGQPIKATRVNLEGYDLMIDLNAVAEHGVRIEKEVQHRDGSCYIMHIMPYFTQDKQVDGVVMTFSDITQLRRAEKQLAAIKGARKK